MFNNGYLFVIFLILYIVIQNKGVIASQLCHLCVINSWEGKIIIVLTTYIYIYKDDILTYCANIIVIKLIIYCQIDNNNYIFVIKY